MDKYLRHFNLNFYLLIFLSIFIPLYPKFPLASVSGTYVAIRLEDIFIAVAFLIWLLSNFKKIKKIILAPVTQAMILFWGIGFLSLISAIYITYSVDSHLGLLNWLRRIEYMGLFVMAATSIKNIKELKIFLVAGVITSILVIVYGFGQYAGLPVISTTNSEYSKGLILNLNPGARPNSTFAGHYDLAIYLTAVLIFIGTFIFYSKRLYQKGILLLSGAGGGMLLGLTAARMSYVATMLGLISVFWVLKKRLLIIALILVSFGVVAAVPQLRHRLIATITVNILGGGGPKYEAPPELIEQNNVGGNQDSTKATSFSAELLATNSATGSPKMPRDVAPGEPVNVTELGVERSLNIRTDVEWPRAIRAFEKNPFLGTGYSSITIASDNDLLRSLGEVGILGTVALVLVFLLILKKLQKSFVQKKGIEKHFLLASIISTLAILITASFIDVLEASKVATMLWMMLGFAYAVANDYDT